MALVTRNQVKEAAQSVVTRPDDIEIERQLDALGRFMDNRFRIPVLGWRFGMNAVIDLIPGIGDAATSLVAIYILASAVRYRVPKITLLRMGLNIVIYFLVGLVPWLGDIFDAWWKPNIRNLSLLRRRATVSAAEANGGKTSDWLFVGVIIAIVLALLAGTVLFSFFILRFIAQSISLR